MIDQEPPPVVGEAPPVVESRPQSSVPPPVVPVDRWLAEHGDVLWRFVLGRVRCQEAAEEVVQEVFVAAMQSHAAYAGASSERTWLLGIASHKIADHFRALRRRATGRHAATQEETGADVVDFHAMFDEKGMWMRPPGSWGMDAGNSAEKGEILAALRRCIDSLPPSQAEVVWLRELMNMPGPEVCKVMGISPTNLWSRMHRARAALRACVERSIGAGKKGTK